jgi:2-oxoisovalerate ferredoxin oxidoreductase beta subunit
MPSVLDRYEAKHAKAKAFYPLYERKSELQHQTHYCPGCGHGIVHKMIAKAIDQLGIQDRTILISPVGCSVFAYYYFDVGNVQVAHGRAPAVATGVKRGCPGSIVIDYQGDGDLSSIGSAEILHAANRGENITVIFINNAIYGMTGGQMAPTTLIGQKTTTSPLGRDPLEQGYPLRMCELLATLEAPAYIERVALGSNKLLAHADRAIHRAIENQVKGIGFSFVEVLSPCPTSWKMTPVDAQAWVADVMTKTFPLAALRNRTDPPAPRASVPCPSVDEIPTILGIQASQPAAEAARDDALVDFRIRVAGFGGQGVLLLGEVLAEAGLEAGLEVSWLPSYGPEMRSGTSNCHVRLSSRAIDAPLVSRPNVLIAMNEPSLRKFLPTIAPGGLVIFNGEELPGDCCPADVHAIATNFTEIAHAVGDPRVTNMVMLGAVLGAARLVAREHVVNAIHRLVKNPHLAALDERALDQGKESL